MRNFLTACVQMFVMSFLSFGMNSLAQDKQVDLRKTIEDARIKHQSEVRRLALNAISQIIPSFARFTERQDHENSVKYGKMLEAFSKSQNYPAKLLPSASIAKEFSAQRRESAKKVYDTYKSAGGVPIDQQTPDPILKELQADMKIFIEQERSLQIQENDKFSPVADSENNQQTDLDLLISDETNQTKKEDSIKNSVRSTYRLFEAFEDLSAEVSQELSEQETTILREKTFTAAKKRIASFWRNKSIAFDCEVIDLSKAGTGYNLRFNILDESGEKITLQIKYLLSSIDLQDIKQAEKNITPGKRFTLLATVTSSLDREFLNARRLGTFYLNPPYDGIAIDIYVIRFKVDWQ
jgi:hypothetical protein